MKRPGGWLVLRSSDRGTEWERERLLCTTSPRPVFCCNNGFWGKSLQGPPPAPGPCRFILGLQSTLLRMIGAAALVMTRPVMTALHSAHNTECLISVWGHLEHQEAPEHLIPSWLTSQGNEAATNDDQELHRWAHHSPPPPTRHPFNWHH